MAEGQVYEKDLKKTLKTGQTYITCRIDELRANDFNTAQWSDVNIGDWVEYETRQSQDGRFTHVATIKKIKPPVQKGQDAPVEREYWVCKRLCYTLATDLVKDMVGATTKTEKLSLSRLEVGKSVCEIGDFIFAAMMRTEEEPQPDESEIHLPSEQVEQPPE